MVHGDKNSVERKKLLSLLDVEAGIRGMEGMSITPSVRPWTLAMRMRRNIML